MEHILCCAFLIILYGFSYSKWVIVIYFHYNRNFKLKLNKSLGVFSISYVSNNYFQRTRIINFEEQTLMVFKKNFLIWKKNFSILITTILSNKAYGGLRGAVAFAMIAVLEEENGVRFIKLFRTTTLVIILFTVFILVWIYWSLNKKKLIIKYWFWSFKGWNYKTFAQSFAHSKRIASKKRTIYYC